MDPIHRQVLDNMAPAIFSRITNTHFLVGFLNKTLTRSEIEDIRASVRSSGDTIGAQKLVFLLQKRGRRAFSSFIDVLKDEQIKLGELADELIEEEERLRGKYGNFTAPEEFIPPPPYTSPTCSEVLLPYDFSNCQISSELYDPALKQQSQREDGGILDLDTPVKDIPYSVRSKIERLLEPLDSSHHDWRGVASVMGLSTEEVRQLESSCDGKGKMSALFEKMVQTKKTVKDLVGWLEHDDVQRFDAIDELKKGGIYTGRSPITIVPGEGGKQEEESHHSMSPLSTHVSKSPMAPEKPSCRIPSQVEEQGDNTSKDACIPSQEEEQGNSSFKDAHILTQEEEQGDNSSKDAHIPSQEEEQGNSSSKDARIPSQVEDTSFSKESVSQEEESDRFPSQEEQAPVHNIDVDDEVFGNAGEVKKTALLISCVNHKEHNAELRNLDEALESTKWEVTIETKCKIAKLLSSVEAFLKEADRNACCFVYLVGVVVNVNGDNYLLPADIGDISCRADLIHGALSINQLVKQLSSAFMQIVMVDNVKQDRGESVLLNYPSNPCRLAPICPPPNAVISFPSAPGEQLPDEKRLLFIRSAIKHVPSQEISLVEFFENIRQDVSQESSCCPVEFTLHMPSYQLCQSPATSEGLPCHAIIFANSKYQKHSFGPTVYAETANLRIALSKAGWNCEAEFCDLKAKSVTQKLKETVYQLADKKLKAVMVYFIGYTQKINNSNYFFGVDYAVENSPPTITDIRKAVKLQWVLDLICEKIYGPKYLIVDDLNKCFNGGLADMTVPQEVLVSLPKSSGDSRTLDDRFTSSFTKLLHGNGALSLKEIVHKASFARHRVNSKLFFY